MVAVPSLQCAQKIDHFLLFLRVQLIKLFDDLIGLAAGAFVRANGLDQVGRATIMQEENALSRAPEGSCTKLVRTRAALGDAVLESYAHVVDEEVRKQIHCLIGECRTGSSGGPAGNHFAGLER